MTHTKKDGGSVAKTVLVGAALLAGVVTAMALKDEKNRKKVKKSLADIQEKGKELKKKAEKWGKNHPLNNDMGEEILEKNPIKKAARAIAGE